MDSTWKSEYNKYIYEEDMEFELRLGKQTANRFISDVGENVFNSIKSKLDKCSWKKIIETIETDYFYQNNIRKTGDCSIVKKNVFKGHKKASKSFDIRFSINSEKPLNAENKVSGNSLGFRKKHRTSYFKDFYRFDLTYIENHDEFEIEMELCDTNYAKKHSYDFIIGNMYLIFYKLVSSSNF